MKLATFKPIWDAFTLPNVVESIGVNIPTKLAIRATVMLEAGEDTILIAPEDVDHITKVLKNGEEQSVYSLVDGILTLPTTFDDVSLVEIERTGTVNYSIFVGKIVPGVSISSTGALRGIIGNIPYKDSHTYTFGIRAKWGEQVADVIKNWVAAPVDNQITWNFDTLSTPQSNAQLVTGRQFHTLGEFRRGQKVRVSIDLFNPDFTDIEVQIRPFAQMVAGPKTFGGVLPMGLSVSNNPFTISGFIPAEAVPGDYMVEVFVDEPYGPTPIILHFKLLGDQFDKFTAINRISWVTEKNLGSIREGHATTFRVSAVNSNGGAVTYRLAPGSRPLPIGMSLTPDGELRGRAPHVGADTVFEFSVKAGSGPYVSTKAFSLKVLKTFVEHNHLTVSLPLSGPTRRSWQSYASQISPNRRFRSNDPMFGSANPSLLLVRGLRDRPIINMEYDKEFELIVGPFKVAKVLDNGIHIYDVIYREFFDPMQNAGGFVAGDANVVESPVFYPQNPAIRINEGTVKNIRSDLVAKVGLNAVTTKRRVLGIGGGELLDRWMTTKQDDGKTIGYIAAGVIDYVQPGKGALVAKSLSYGDIPVGTSITFDRLLIQNNTASYYYYLGWDRNDESNISIAPPHTPRGFVIDGISVDIDVALHSLPLFAWIAVEEGVTYTLRFFSGTTLIRTEEGITSTTFSYSEAMQAEDGTPGHLFVELTAVRDSRESPPVIASVRLRDGWGYAWGFRYGGAD
jgi:hypothetical protein